MSILSTRLTTATLLTADGLIPYGGVTHKEGCDVRASGTTLTIDGAGHYIINANAVVAPTVAGTVVVTMFDNGQPVASGEGTIATAGDAVTIPLLAVVFNKCKCNQHVVTIQVDVASTVTELDVVVEGR